MAALLALAAAALTAAACARYEWKNELDVPELCPRDTTPPPPPPPPPPPRVIGGAGGRVTGQVLRKDTESPLVGVAVFVVLPTTPVRGAYTDSLGRFTLDSVPPGAHVLRARSIGYRVQEAPVVVRPDSGPALRVELAPDTLMLDGPCSGYAKVRVRKPWRQWKWW